jgi:hypothetical protein
MISLCERNMEKRRMIGWLKNMKGWGKEFSMWEGRMISIFGREVGEYPDMEGQDDLPVWEKKSLQRETQGIPYGRGEDNLLSGREEGRDHNMEEGRMTSPVHCNENSIFVFLFWALHSLSPNFHSHVCVSDYYIPRIGLHISRSK